MVVKIRKRSDGIHFQTGDQSSFRCIRFEDEHTLVSISTDANLDISHFYAIEDMMRAGGMSEIQAVLAVVRGMRAPAAGRGRASIADIQAQATRPPLVARDFTLSRVAGSGRTVIAGADYGNGIRSTNDQFFGAASSMSRKIAIREQLDAARTLELQPTIIQKHALHLFLLER